MITLKMIMIKSKKLNSLNDSKEDAIANINKAFNTEVTTDVVIFLASTIPFVRLGVSIGDVVYDLTQNQIQAIDDNRDTILQYERAQAEFKTAEARLNAYNNNGVTIEVNGISKI